MSKGNRRLRIADRPLWRLIFDYEYYSITVRASLGMIHSHIYYTLKKLQFNL